MNKDNKINIKDLTIGNLLVVQPFGTLSKIYASGSFVLAKNLISTDHIDVVFISSEKIDSDEGKVYCLIKTNEAVINNKILSSFLTINDTAYWPAYWFLKSSAYSELFKFSVLNFYRTYRISTVERKSKKGPYVVPCVIDSFDISDEIIIDFEKLRVV